MKSLRYPFFVLCALSVVLIQVPFIAIGQAPSEVVSNEDSESYRTELAVERLAIEFGDRGLYPDVDAGPDDQIVMSWLEPTDTGGHRLMMTSWTDDGFSAPRSIAQGENWFVNWADFPSVVATGDDRYFAHWLERLESGTYAYGIRIAMSDDGGRTWGEPVWLHEDLTPNEHGFVSTAVLDDGSLWALWLDSRDFAQTGNMSLRARLVLPNGQLGPEHLLDDRVCSCCQTSAVALNDQIFAVYRDRSVSEVRDISIARWSTETDWQSPLPVAFDEWLVFR